MSVVNRTLQGEGVVHVELFRPDRRNALSSELVEALLAEVHHAERDPAIKVMVISGAGGTFCAGGDLAGGLTGAGGAVDLHRARGRFAELLKAIMQSPVVVIAAVEGAAMGGGLGLAAACDLVVASRSAKFGTPEIKVGLYPWIILAVLQRNVGRKRLMEMILTGTPLFAPRAEEIGLINRVVDDGEAVASAMAWAEDLSGRAPIPLSLGKEIFQGVSDLGLDDALRLLNAHLSLNLMTEDAMEGVGAFLQRREPQWKGR
jgi:enoyl-CoA hydratase/carnithine racemase